MKTPIQEAIEALNDQIKTLSALRISRNHKAIDCAISSLTTFREQCLEKMLEKEKETIVNFASRNCTDLEDFIDPHERAMEIFTETFNK